MILEDLASAVERGKRKEVKVLVPQALEEGYSVEQILNEGLIAPMGVIGDKFSRNEVFVPEMLVAARAMSTGTAILEPLMADSGIQSPGTVIVGTVKGDLHDIGKNLCAMMLRGVGATVIDLGVDVAPETFLEKAQSENADVVCLSALLTTTMPAMKETIEAFKGAGIRDQYFIMVGGAPVTQAFADEIGADCYTDDANECAKAAKAYLDKKYA